MSPVENFMKPPSGEGRRGHLLAGSLPEFLSSSVVGRLTTDQLSALPQRNNDIYILAYIHEQRAYIKHYISTQTKSTSWQQAELELSSPAAEEPLDDFNFGTPVLKARISQSGNRTVALNPQRENTHIPRNPFDRCLVQNTQRRVGEISHFGDPKKTTPNHQGTESEEVHQADTKKATPNVKVHHGSNTIINQSETERAKRLAERRQRKRAKRDIIKSPRNSDKENNDEDLSKKTNRKKGKGPTTHKKLQAGFALMHGLSTTNVGRNRLTLNPLLQNAGVFKKGKASGIAKVAKMASKKRDISNVHFSELKFLGKRTRKTSQASSTQSSITASTRSDVPKKLEPCHDRPVVEKTTHRDDVSQVESVQTKTSRKPYNPEESIIWDIEKENHTEEPGHRASSNSVHGTILVKFRANNPDRKAGAQECLLAGDNLATSMKPSACDPIPEHRISNGDSGDHMSFLSLGPSQSASQIRAPEQASERQDLGDTSKYFKELATTPTYLFKPPEARTPASVQEASPRSLLVMDLRVSHLPPAPDDCLMTVEPSYDSMQDCLSAYSTHTQASFSGFDFSNSPYPGLPYAWNIDDNGTFDSDSYQNCDMVSDGCYSFESVLAETNDVNKQFGAEAFTLETPLDNFGMYQTHHEALQDEFGEERSGDFEAADETRLDYCVDNQGESNIHSEISYIWTSQPSASIRDDDRPSEKLDIYETCSSHLHPESDLELVVDNLNFYQGRTLLFGLSDIYQGELQTKTSNRLLNVEVEVAGSLKQNHWLPQRP